MATEFEKWSKGEPFNSSRAWAEMDDDLMDKLLDELKEGSVDTETPIEPPNLEELTDEDESSETTEG